jgi:hypothetical protein
LTQSSYIENCQRQHSANQGLQPPENHFWLTLRFLPDLPSPPDFSKNPIKTRRLPEDKERTTLYKILKDCARGFERKLKRKGKEIIFFSQNLA